MPTRTEVITILSQVMRNTLIANTPFTDEDPDESERGFHWGLVPSKSEWSGWRADEQSWHTNLGDIATALAAARPSYPALTFTEPFVGETLDIELVQTLTRIADMILEGGDNA